VIAVDTNVLLRWLIGDDAARKTAADQFFEGLTARDPGFVHSVTMAELCWVLRTAYGLPKARVLDVLEGLLSTEELEFDDGEGMWQALFHARAGADYPDALIAETARRFGCSEVVTFDRDAARLLGMRLLEGDQHE
jgi:predicted nucleic-acid-binding protein